MAAAAPIPCSSTRSVAAAACLLLATGGLALPAEPAVNYDEAKVGTSALPDLLAGPDGTRATARSSSRCSRRTSSAAGCPPWT
jgi:hypothetical protein